jgi:hypothetical protein
MFATVSSVYVKWDPHHHGMVRPQVVHGGENLQISRVAENILNKHSLTADRGGPRAWGLGSGLTTPTIKNGT